MVTEYQAELNAHNCVLANPQQPLPLTNWLVFLDISNFSLMSPISVFFAIFVEIGTIFFTKLDVAGGLVVAVCVHAVLGGERRAHHTHTQTH